jgi:hypothetical protein
MPLHTRGLVEEEKGSSFSEHPPWEITSGLKVMWFGESPRPTLLEELFKGMDTAASGDWVRSHGELAEIFGYGEVATLTPDEYVPLTSLGRPPVAPKVSRFPLSKGKIRFRDLLDKQLVRDLGPEPLLSKLGEVLDYLQEHEPHLFHDLYQSPQAIDLSDLHTTLEFIGAIEMPPDFDLEEFLRLCEELAYGGE